MNTRKKYPMSYEERHWQMLAAGKKLANGADMGGINGATIARMCNCTAPLVFSHFKDRDGLREAVRQYVKTGKYPPIVRHPRASKPIAQVRKIKEKVAAKKSPAKKVAAGTAKRKKPAGAAKASAPVVKVSSKLTPPAAPGNAQ